MIKGKAGEGVIGFMEEIPIVYYAMHISVTNRYILAARERRDISCSVHKSEGNSI